MKNYLFGILAVLVMAGFGYVIQTQRSEIAGLKKQLASYEEAEAVGEVKSTDEMVAGSESADVAESASAGAANASEVKPSESENSSRRVMRNMSEMMENPTMNKMMVASQKATLEVLYEDLMEFLVLDENEKKYFMDLLMDRQMIRVQNAMKMMGGGLTEDERAEIAQQMKSADEKIREEMDYFLNSKEDLEEWKFYEKTMGERMTVSGFEDVLAKAEIPLKEGVGRDLIKIMNEEKEGFNFSTDLGDESKMDMSPERFSEENIQKFNRDIEELDTLIAKRVMELLSTPQFEQFLKNQEQMRQMKASQLKMAAQMFSNQARK